MRSGPEGTVTGSEEGVVDEADVVIEGVGD